MQRGMEPRPAVCKASALTSTPLAPSRRWDDHARLLPPYHMLTELSIPSRWLEKLYGYLKLRHPKFDNKTEHREMLLPVGNKIIKSEAAEKTELHRIRLLTKTYVSFKNRGTWSPGLPHHNKTPSPTFKKKIPQT